jgi:RNA polymerase sigma-70 factor (ECF subfamily)
MRRRDEEFARRVSDGDAAACAEFVRMHYERVYRFLAHMCRHEHIAEDLTQETFAAAWVAMGKFNGSSSLSTWLHQIARSKFLDHCRRERRSARVTASEPAGPDDESRDPLDNLLADEQSRQLARGLALMAPDSREVVVLHYSQGLSYREMAHVLGAPAGTVKWRVSQAMKELKAILTSGAEHDS